MERKYDPLKEVHLLINTLFLKMKFSYIWLFHFQNEKNHQEKEDKKYHLQIKIYQVIYNLYHLK